MDHEEHCGSNHIHWETIAIPYPFEHHTHFCSASYGNCSILTCGARLIVGTGRTLGMEEEVHNAILFPMMGEHVFSILP